MRTPAHVSTQLRTAVHGCTCDDTVCVWMPEGGCTLLAAPYVPCSSSCGRKKWVCVQRLHGLIDLTAGRHRLLGLPMCQFTSLTIYQFVNLPVCEVTSFASSRCTVEVTSLEVEVTSLKFEFTSLLRSCDHFSIYQFVKLPVWCLKLPV